MRAIQDETLKTGETKQVHKFTLAGLGQAPFRFTGMEEKVYVACQGAPEQPAGTCCYCGTGIRYCYHIESADGQKSYVGSDCIHKSDDSGLVKLISKAEAELRSKKNEKARVAKAARLAARVEAAKKLLPSVAGKLAELPHPNQYFAANGKTLGDYVAFLMRAGAGPQAQACGIIEDAAK